MLITLGCSLASHCLNHPFGPSRKLQRLRKLPLGLLAVKPDTSGKPLPWNTVTVKEQNRLWLIPFPGKQLCLFRISLNYQPVCIKLPFKKCPQIKYFPINLRHKLLFFFCFQSKALLSHFRTSGTPSKRGYCEKATLSNTSSIFFLSL